MNDEEQDMKRIREHCDQLIEHFDSVQIFCTRHEAGKKDGTLSVQYGAGNWFARHGQVQEWLAKRDEESRISIRNQE